MKSQSLLIVMALGVAIAGPAAASETLIYVNFGPYRSADVTGHTEGHVKWNDDDLTDDVVCTEAFAALELQHYLQKLTRKFNDFDTMSDTSPVTKDDLIIVGSPTSNLILREHSEELGLDLKKLGVDEKNLAELGCDGYSIRSLVIGGRRVTILAGSNRVGTLYASYDLLQRLGCRWLVPGEMHVEVPHIEGIPNLSITERLPAAPRVAPNGDADGKASIDYFLWMARNQFNSCESLPEQTALMHKLGIVTRDTLSQKIR